MPSEKHYRAKDSQDKAKRYKERNQKTLGKIIDFFFDSAYQVVTWVWIAISISSFFFFAGKPEGQRGRGMMWSFISLVLSVIVMILLLAKRYFWDSDGKPIDRPELSTERVYVKTLEAGKPEIIMMEIQNRGKLTAHNVTIYSTLVHEYTTFQGPLIHKPTTPEVAASIASGATVTCAFHSTWINTAAAVEAIKSGTIQLFHFGKGHYEDNAGNRYPFDYCFLYDPSSPRSMMVCPLRYWPTKDGPLPIPTRERPELFVERATAELIPGKPKRAAIEFVNRGNKAATRFTVWMNQGLAEPDFPGPLKFEALEPDTRPSIGPNGTVTLMGGKNEPITLAEYKAICDGTRVWFIFGKGLYEDGVGNTWPIDFCFQYEPSIAPVMRICPDKYWPKQVQATLPERRPELSLEYAEGTCVPGKPASVRVIVENRGDATAYEITVEATNFFAVARTFKGPMEHEPSDPPYVYPSLAPGASIEGHTKTDIAPLSIQNVADIRDRKLLFLHYSKGTYKDKEKNAYPFDFCLLYDPDRPVMIIAPKEFWPRSLSDF
jgi:hypothetical protein